MVFPTFIGLFLSIPSFAQEFTVTDAQISEITEKLQSLDENELKNRKIEIEKELANLQDADDKDSASARISALMMELLLLQIQFSQSLPFLEIILPMLSLEVFM